MTTERRIGLMAAAALWLASTAIQAQEFAIDAGVEGGWFFPDTAGQGFLIDYIEGDPPQLFVAWFTFESGTAKIGDAQHRWLTAQGPVDGASANLTLLSTAGGVFDQGGGVTIGSVGTISIDFSACNQAVVTYQFDGGPSGSIPIQPVDPGLANCSPAKSSPPRLSKVGEYVVDAGIQGGWFFPPTAGQGFLVDFIDTTPAQLFVAWFTFEEPASGKIGAIEHRWLTAQGPLVDGNTAQMTLLSTDGGVFDQASTVNIGPVGTLNMDFSSCREATVDYQFDGGPDGTISLIPVDPNLADCEFTLVTGDPPDECRPNGIRLFDGSVINEEIKPARDADYYRIVLDRTSTIRAFSSGNLDTIGRIHDANCSTLNSDDNSGPGTNFDLEGTDLVAGTYFVSVRSVQDSGTCIGALCKPAFDATGPYTLGIAVQSDQPAPDQFPDTCDVSQTPLLGNGGSISGRIDPAQDLDFFRIDVADDNTQLRVSSAGGLDALGRIYDVNCGLIDSDDNSGTGNNFDVATVVDSGTYFASVESAGSASTGDYVLNVALAPAVVQPDDFPNTCDAMGVALSDGQSINGSIEVIDDLDFFRVEVASNNTLLRAFTTGNDLDTVGRVFDAQCNEIAFNDDSPVDENFDVAVAVDAGTFYVSVESFGLSDTGTYTLNIQLLDATGIGDDFPNTCDFNAAPQLQDGAMIPGSIEVPDDLDFFRVDVSEDNTTVIAGTSGTTDTIGAILDANCEQLAFNDDTVAGTNFEVVTVVDPGTYYVSVGSFGAASTGNYVLNLQIGVGITGDDDFPNLCDFNNSPLLGDGQSISGDIEIPEDRDFFRVDVDTDNASLRGFTTADIDTVGRVYNAACEQIATDDDGGEGVNFDVLAVNLSPGTYYLSVESFDQSEFGSYTLTVEIGDSADVVDSFPNTCDVENSPLMGDGSFLEGNIFPADDADFFRVDINASSTLRAFTTGDLDTVGTIYNFNCDFITEDDDGGANTNFDVSSLLNPGTYYIGVESFDNIDTGDYTITVEIN